MDELALNLCTAYIAAMGGFRDLNYVKKIYVKGDVGPVWNKLAEQVYKVIEEGAPVAIDSSWTELEAIES